MKVYEYLNSEEFRFLTIPQEHLRRFRLELAVGKPLSKEFPSIELDDCADVGSPRSSFADFIGFFSGGLLVNDSVRDVINPLICGCGEWIPMSFNGENLSYFNVTKCLDLLNVERTAFTRFQGMITGIVEHSFHSLDIKDTPIFKLSFNPKLPPLVTQVFVDFVAKNDLSGLVFREVGSN